MRYAMIMAGGAGTRLWPMSRKGRPKQLLRFIEQPGDAQPHSLLEIAAGRLEGLIAPEQRFICTAEGYRAAIREALPEFDDRRILGEPMGRDTVNAVGLAAAVFQKQDPDAVFAVLTADHIIEPIDKFQSLIDLGFRLVESDPSRLVTFSIKPTYPATPLPASATSSVAHPSRASAAATTWPSASSASSRSPTCPGPRPTSSPGSSAGTAACSCGRPRR
jgi:mannose-1-phosphate guanylyltransferase